ncbi:hypothetical protein K469DRAFT_702898 [Zopfia rhizophila CBS 207.26]|uniref:BZIP domain-containing protein n=1 Tax=Zopfia rhizophila CBS 207.26 TaxID=1314779 RepID=A0A6A6D7Z6_9PEZI|nr:hypothetical protein K469DRAFT_702898 [Zopfia rhizophila CBS 207.26]
MNATHGNQRVSLPPTVLPKHSINMRPIQPFLNVNSANQPETSSSRGYGPPQGPSFLSTPAYEASPRKLNAPSALPPIHSFLDIAPILPEANLSLQSSSDAPGSCYKLMTFKTQHGPIDIPVDVGAGSIEAKTKRTCTAKNSQRYRQRQNKAARTIALLEQKLRKMEELLSERGPGQ